MPRGPPQKERIAVRYFVLAAMALTVVATSSVAAKDIKVQMKNRGAAGSMVFEPSLIQASPGDTVTFVPTNPSHNAQTIDGFLPDGVAPTKGAMNKPVTLRVSKPGLYGIECQPHFGLGMVALVKVGTGASPNLAKAKLVKLPPLAQKRMAPMLAAAR